MKTVLLFFLSISFAFAQKPIISGYVKEKGSLEKLPGVNVYLEGTSTGVQTNNFGFFSIPVPDNKGTLIISFVGYQKQEIELTGGNQELEIELALQGDLEEVVVSAKAQNDRISDTPQMSKIDLPVDQIKKIPALFGEKDVFKVLQLMPGVQSGSEGQSGLYVRGGGPDQNLIILDDATVYNANHLFGFFSVFNGDALKSVELTKGGFPARYGGRLSSVVELQMKDGNKEKISGEGGIGLIASRLTLEGPIKKGKSSFLISGRRTYLDILTRPIIKAQSEGTAVGGYYFYDLNAKANFDLSSKDKLYVSGYFGKDRFYAKEDDDSYKFETGLDWGNATATLRWNHQFNQKLFVNTSLIYSKFNFGVNALDVEKRDNEETTFSMNYDSDIEDFSLKTDFDYFLNNKHTLKIGAQIIRHTFIPSAVSLKDEFVNENLTIKAKKINSFENGIYIEDLWKPTDKLRFNYGLRVSNFNTETKTYIKPEPRFSMGYKIKSDFSIKASYAKMNQYIHLLSNTGIGLPTDLWVPTTDLVKPQESEQVAIGLAKDFKQAGLTFTAEAYYKRMNNIISYKEGSSFLSIDGEDLDTFDWENNITSGKGYSKGIELLVQKKLGKFTGWAGYTLSYTKWQFDDLNNGKEFFPRYDRRHDISLVGIYEFNKRISLSGTWVYGTGNALTLPLGNFNANQPYNARFNGPQIENYNNATYYGEKNSWRAEAYHRFDISLQFTKQKKRHERTWEFSIYNLYSRKNPFFYATAYKYPEDSSKEPGKTVLNRYSVFPFVPSITYNFKF